MASHRGQKRQLEMARLEKAALKRSRRQQRGGDEPVASDIGDNRPPEADVLAALADLHRRFADDEIPLEDFEAEREALNNQLRIT